MSRKRTAPSPSKVPAGVTKVPGVLICKVCRFTVPYQGYEDPTVGDGRPTHRCVDSIRAFDTFDTSVRPVKVRQW